MTIVDESIPKTADAPTVSQFLDSLTIESRSALRALGNLLTSAPVKTQGETGLDFITRVLGVEHISGLVIDQLRVSSIDLITAGLAVAELGKQAAETGPGKGSVVRWSRVELGDDVFEIPASMGFYFPRGTAHPATDVVVRMIESEYEHASFVEIYAHPDQHTAARDVLNRIVERGRELSPFRGKILRGVASVAGLRLDLITLPPVDRDQVIVPDNVWQEIDLAISAVTDQAPLLDRLGLGCRRGVMLCGPPGTGKSAVSAVVARELNAQGFTVIYVEAKAGATLLSSVMETGIALGSLAVVLEDIDLFVSDRRKSASPALAEMLSAMDIRPDARVLTVASTNDTSGMDPASIRAGRFDAVVEVGTPDVAAAQRILNALLGESHGVDTAVVARALKPGTSGADLKEIVRRTVLITGGEVTTDAMLRVVRDGSYRPQLPAGLGGQYL